MKFMVLGKLIIKLIKIIKLFECIELIGHKPHQAKEKRGRKKQQTNRAADQVFPEALKV